MKGFATLAQTALASKALDGKTKELIALAIAVAVRCDDCIGFHVKAAVAQGASREEVAETLGMAIYMGAGCTPATRWKRSISSQTELTTVLRLHFSVQDIQWRRNSVMASGPGAVEVRLLNAPLVVSTLYFLDSEAPIPAR